jgi:hypothetical protein
MEGSLVKYEAARQALAEAHRVDEVKDIRDKAMALQVYAQQAKDRDLIEHATEIRLRAERRLGEMMAEQPKAKGAREPGTNRGTTRVDEKPTSPPSAAASPFPETLPPSPRPITLADAGIDKNLANRARKAAALSEVQFETSLSQAKKAAVAAVEKKTRGAQAGTSRKPTVTPKPKAAESSSLPIPTSFEDVDRSLGIIGMQWLVAARQKIESATVAEIKEIVVTAMALQSYYRSNVDAKREADKIALLAMRRGGPLLKEMERNGERKAARAKKGMRVGTQPGLSLPQLGITRKDSMKWQKVGRLTEKQFQALLNKSDPPHRSKAKKIEPSEQPPIQEILSPPDAAAANRVAAQPGAAEGA